jgi:hypothetical protein
MRTTGPTDRPTCDSTRHPAELRRQNRLAGFERRMRWSPVGAGGFGEPPAARSPCVGGTSDLRPAAACAPRHGGSSASSWRSASRSPPPHRPRRSPTLPTSRSSRPIRYRRASPGRSAAYGSPPPARRSTSSVSRRSARARSTRFPSHGTGRNRLPRSVPRRASSTAATPTPRMNPGSTPVSSSVPRPPAPRSSTRTSHETSWRSVRPSQAAPRHASRSTGCSRSTA